MVISHYTFFSLAHSEYAFEFLDWVQSPFLCLESVFLAVVFPPSSFFFNPSVGCCVSEETSGSIDGLTHFENSSRGPFLSLARSVCEPSCVGSRPQRSARCEV